MPRPPPFKETIVAWDQAMVNDPQISPKTRDTYIPAAWRIFRFAQAHGWPMNVKKLEPRHYMEYYQSIQGLASKTQSTYMCAFTALLKFAENPYAAKCRVRIQAERGEVTWAERPQVIKMFQTAPNPRVLAAEVIFAFTGIREFEARALRERSLTDNWLIVNKGKRSKGRKIPIDDEFWAMLEPYMKWRAEYPAKSDYVLVHPQYSNRGKLGGSGPLVPYQEYGLSLALHRHGESLDPQILGISSHSFRRYFGRSLYYAGCPPAQIQNYYGHKTLAQTMDYIGINDEMSREAMEKYRPKYLDDVRGKKP